MFWLNQRHRLRYMQALPPLYFWRHSAHHRSTSDSGHLVPPAPPSRLSGQAQPSTISHTHNRAASLGMSSDWVPMQRHSDAHLHPDYGPSYSFDGSGGMYGSGPLFGSAPGFSSLHSTHSHPSNNISGTVHTHVNQISPRKLSPNGALNRSGSAGALPRFEVFFQN